MAHWLIFFLVLFANSSLSAAESQANYLAIGQGVSSPASTSVLNFSSGFTSENPLGVLYQNGGRVSGQYDQNGSKGFGAELGYGSSSWGLAAGFSTRDCTGCKGSGVAAVGLEIAGVGFGLRFAENLYGAGLILNPSGGHRLGFVAQLNETGGAGQRITAGGVGYSYVGTQITFTVDASKRQLEDTTSPDDRILVTPGLMLRADLLQISLNDRITLNATDTQTGEKNKVVHDYWFGIGFARTDWHLAFYIDYVNELAIAGTLFF